MKKIFSWILLVGFLLLLVNIIAIGFQRTLSIAVYIVVALAFLFMRKKGA